MADRTPEQEEKLNQVLKELENRYGDQNKAIDELTKRFKQGTKDFDSLEASFKSARDSFQNAQLSAKQYGATQKLGNLAANMFQKETEAATAHMAKLQNAIYNNQ